MLRSKYTMIRDTPSTYLFLFRPLVKGNDSGSGCRSGCLGTIQRAL